MCFRPPRWSLSVVLCGLCVMLASLSPGCNANVTDQGEVFPDVAQRVEQQVLPEIVEESQAVLRNLVNFLAALPEICATPLADLGSFVSSMPVLAQPATVAYDDGNGEWTLTWLNAVLGDSDDQLTVDTTTPSVDIILRLFFRTQARGVQRAVPFALAPMTTLQLDGDPPSYAAGLLEGFFLSQDATSGQWRLRWRALNTPKVFAGTITAETGTAGVVKRIVDGVTNTVESTTVNSTSNTISFEETTAVAEEKGLTFFVRPGERVRFRLSLRPVDGTLQPISREQLRLGPADQLLLASKDPTDFILGSALPINPTGDPMVDPDADEGTFLWQDTVTNGCNVGEDQWRLRFSRQTGTPTFSGTLTSIDDDVDALITSASRVGSCPAGSISTQRTFEYACMLTDNTLSGYDLCVSNSGRLNITTRRNSLTDPRFVFVGENRSAPPSPLPFSILFNIEIMERQSAMNIRFSNASILLQGNTTSNESEQVILNPDQVSFDPLCRVPGEAVQPRVRFTGRGDYATARFEGSNYILDQVRFTDANVNVLTDRQRFPDRGEIRLITRVAREIENSQITALMQDIVPVNGAVSLPVDVEINVDDVQFLFPNQNIILTVE